ncbi:DUF2515 family protein [Pseudorhodoferax sp.]|uniref:DUF2515 family protein n=1 Tax=Pseudorhodoferax sp. TaxID=1993553 RepID=UPI0039E5F2F7
MADGIAVEAMTNSTPNSCVDVKCDCNTMWSLVQQLSYLRLSQETGDFKATLVADPAVRARRIAATYARFYLEQEEGCDRQKKGRFYWMALGAFASKTVACTLELRRVRMQAMFTSKVKDGLSKGNLWLFCDISGWHWYYCKFSNSFDACFDSRNAGNYVPKVKAQLAKLPWSGEALPKINQMAMSASIKNGFEKIKDFEAEIDPVERWNIQFKHLMAIAEHEKGVILQPLIYRDKDFVGWLEIQRSSWVNWASPNLELVFSSACISDDAELKSVAPSETKLEDLSSRMLWIEQAADKFHKLMQRRKLYMEGEIQKMAAWAALSD